MTELELALCKYYVRVLELKALVDELAAEIRAELSPPPPPGDPRPLVPRYESQWSGESSSSSSAGAAAEAAGGADTCCLGVSAEHAARASGRDSSRQSLTAFITSPKM